MRSGHALYALGGRLTKHPLVAHYGCPPGRMRLARAHAAVEGSHRRDAWRILLGHVPDDDATLITSVLETCERALEGWHRYRDGVAERMGLRRAA